MSIKKKMKFPQKWSLPALLAFSPVFASVLLLVVSFLLVTILITSQLHIDLRPHIIVLAIILALLPLSVIYLQKNVISLKNIVTHIVNNRGEDIDDLFKGYTNLLYDSLIAYIGPLLFGIVSIKTMTSMIGMPWLGRPSTAIVYQILVGLLLVMAASVGWHFLCFLFLLRQINSLSISGEPFRSQKREFTQLSQITINVFVLGIVIYLAVIIDIWIVPWGDYLLLSTPLGYYWVFPLAVIMLAYFAVGRYLFNRFSKHSKQQRLDKIDLLINNAFDRWSAESSESSVTMFSTLIKWREVVNQDVDGLIGFRESITIIGSILIPALGALVDLIPKIRP